MKQLIIVIVAILFISNINAQQGLPIKIYEITAVNVSSGYTTNVTGKELNSFQVPKNANSVKMSVQIPVKDYKKYRLPNQLQLNIHTVGKADKVDILNSYWSTLYKDTLLVSACYFPPGDYELSLIDQVHPETVFAKRSIAVKGTETPGKVAKSNVIVFDGFTYDPANFKIWTCKSVDDVNWKPVGQTNKTSVGGCITFFFESTEKIKNPGVMRWKLYKVDADGKEVFVNQRDQTIVLEQFRRMYYEECGEFNTPGKYRVYLAIRNESEAYYGVRDKDYFASADVIVQ